MYWVWVWVCACVEVSLHLWCRCVGSISGHLFTWISLVKKKEEKYKNRYNLASVSVTFIIIYYYNY